MQYEAKVYPASSSLGALKADLLTPGIENLVINKGSRIEIYALDPTGLRLLSEVPLNGTAVDVRAIKLPGAISSTLVVLTACNRLFTLQLTEDQSELCTGSSVSIAEHTARPADLCQTIVIDAQCTFIGIHAYNGLFRVCPLIRDVKKRRGSHKGDTEAADQQYAIDLERSYNIRLPEYNVHSVCVFNPPDLSSPPALVILHDDHQSRKVLKVRPVLLHDKDFADEAETQSFILDDYGSELLISVPGKGVIVVGEAKATFVALADQVIVDAKGKRRSSSSASSPSVSSSKRSRKVDCRLPLGAYSTATAIDESPNSFLLGDLYGELHLLQLVIASDGRISGITAEDIGKTSSATALVYLANRFLFVASHYGDSQLLQLSAIVGQPPRDQSSWEDQDMSEPAGLDLINTFTNLAPIVDFCVVNSEFGQSYMVTCSGGYSDGSLRIVSHGVGLTELATIDMENVQRIFPLSTVAAGMHDLLLLSFVNETRAFRFGSTEDEGIEEVTELSGLDLSTPTLDAFCHNGIWYQITSSGIRCSNGQSWKPHDLIQKVTVAIHSTDVFVLALSGGALAHFISGTEVLTESKTTVLPQEIACMAFHTLPSSQQILVVGLWSSHEVLILDATTLVVLTSSHISTDFLLRSILPITFDDGTTSIFVGLGDGVLTNLPLEETKQGVIIREDAKKSITLGSRPIVMTAFRSEQGPSVFLSSDQPTVISRSKGRLTYATVNLRDVNAVETFNSIVYPDSLVFASPEGLHIGRIEQVESIHIRTILLAGDQPRRITHSPELKVFGILCIGEAIDNSMGVITRSSNFKIVDDATFDVLLDYNFDDDEQGLSVSAVRLAVGAPPCLVVGCATILANESQTKHGRILVFGSNEERAFSLVTMASCRGAPYALGQISTRNLAATVNSQVCIYTLTSDKVLEEVTSWGGTFLATTMVTKGERLLVGDALRSVTLLEYTSNIPGLPKLYEEAREFTANGIMSLDLLSDTRAIAADIDMNLFTMIRSADETAKTAQTLQQAGLYHLAEVVTRIHHGSLVPNFAQSSSVSSQQLLYTTSNGSIGIIAELDPKIGQSLAELQRNMRRVVPAYGGLEHQAHREYKTDYRKLDSVGFIDGSFVERWADLSQPQRDSVLAGGTEAEQLSLRSEELTALVEACELMH